MDNKTLHELSNNSENAVELNKYKLLSLTADEKEEYVDKMVIIYPLMKQILADIDECKNSSNRLNEIKSMFISGGSRYGKTVITKVYMRSNPDVVEEEVTLKPVLYVKVPAPAYTGSLKSAVLKYLGDPFYDKILRGYQVDSRIAKMLEKCGVKLIILDEFQHLVEGNRHKVLIDSSDWFKNLIDDCGISVVFTGLPYAEQVLTQNEQLGNRVKIRRPLKPFDFNDNCFRNLLNQFDTQLPLEQKSNLAQDGNWQRIYLATGGIIGFVKALLTESTKLAAIEKLPCIDDEILYKAYNNKLYYTSSDNPFSPTYNLRKAIKDKALS
jgi:hypothetical protein